MTTEETKRAIEAQLKALVSGDLHSGAIGLWKALGYTSDLTLPIETLEELIAATERSATPLRLERALIDRWSQIRGLFQLTDEEIHSASSSQLRLDSFDSSLDLEKPQSYLFFAIDLKQEEKPLTRTELAQITREVNRPFPMPVLLLFRQNGLLTLAVQDRRLNKKDNSRDVLEKVTLITHGSLIF